MSAPRQLTEMRLPDLGYNAYLCRYSEIALKGRNRASFERAAVANLKRLLEGLPLSVRRERGRVFLQPEPPGDTLTAGVVEALRRQTAKCFGLVSGSPAFLTAPELPAIEAAVDRSFGAVCAAVAAQLGEGMPIPYAMRARRSEHRLGMTSREIEIHFADRLLTRHPCLRVNLDNPLLRVEVEVRREHAFVSYERFPGPGGLPACTAGRVMVLLSGGIDSPVAAYLTMRRGGAADFVTFHSAPYTPPATVEKVARIVRILREFQGEGTLYAVNLAEPQKLIRDRCSERFRTVLYRRLMLRVAAELARRREAAALVTGDSLGQVASQTLANLAVISAATPMLVLRPLIGAEKRETMDLARSIGTLAISEEQVPDSCTVFAPANPVTKAPLPLVEAQERRLPPPDELTRLALAQTTRVNVDTLETGPLPPDPAAAADTGRD